MSNPVFVKYTGFSLLLVFVLSACSIHKRHYRPGYYVHTTKSKHSTVSTSGKDRDLHLKGSTAADKALIKKMAAKPFQTSLLSGANKTAGGLTQKPQIQRHPLNAAIAHKAYLPERSTHASRKLITHPAKRAKAIYHQTKTKQEKNKDMTRTKNPKRRTALMIGIALLLMALVAAFSAPVISSIFVSGNPTLTALNLSSGFGRYTGSVVGWVIILVLDLLVALGVYKYYKKEKPKMALTSGLLRLVYSIVLGAAIYQLLGLRAATPAATIYNHLDTFNAVWGWGLIIFGLHLIALGILFKNEGGKKWLTITIKTLLIVSGIGYIVLYAGMLIVPSPLAFKAIVEPIFLIPMILGEVFFALWMLIKGGKERI